MSRWHYEGLAIMLYRTTFRIALIFLDSSENIIMPRYLRRFRSSAITDHQWRRWRSRDIQEENDSNMEERDIKPKQITPEEHFIKVVDIRYSDLQISVCLPSSVHSQFVSPNNCRWVIFSRWIIPMESANSAGGGAKPIWSLRIVSPEENRRQQ